MRPSRRRCGPRAAAVPWGRARPGRRDRARAAGRPPRAVRGRTRRRWRRRSRRSGGPPPGRRRAGGTGSWSRRRSLPQPCDRSGPRGTRPRFTRPVTCGVSGTPALARLEDTPRKGARGGAQRRGRGGVRTPVDRRDRRDRDARRGGGRRARSARRRASRTRPDSGRGTRRAPDPSRRTGAAGCSCDTGRSCPAGSRQPPSRCGRPKGPVAGGATGPFDDVPCYAATPSSAWSRASAVFSILRTLSRDRPSSRPSASSVRTCRPSSP